MVQYPACKGKDHGIWSECIRNLVNDYVFAVNIIGIVDSNLECHG